MDDNQTAISGGTVPAAEYIRLAEKYDSLRKRYDSTVASNRDLSDRLVLARDKLDRSKQIVKGWQQWYDAHPKYRDHKTAQTSSTDSCSGEDTSDGNLPVLSRVLDPEVASIRAFSRHSSETGHSAKLPAIASLASKMAQDASKDSRPLSSRSSSAQHRNTSSQTTEGEPLDDVQVKQEDSNRSSSPVVVSVRSLRRSRDSPASSRRYATPRQTGNSDLPVAIKEEGSSPIRPPAALLRTETSDLDVLQHDNSTPRKRQKLQSLGLERIQQHTENHSPTSAEVQDPSTITSVRHSFPGRMQENNPPQPHPQIVKEGRDAVSRSFPSSRSFGEDDINQTTPRAYKTNTLSKRKTSGPLQPLSTNTLPLPRTSCTTPKTAVKRKFKDSGAAAIHHLSEDSNPVAAANSRLSKNKTLNSLLEGNNLPSPRVVISPRAPNTARRLRQSHEAEAVTTPTTRTRNRVSPGKTTTLAQTRGRSPVPVLPEHEPLRARPVNRLNLSDFKINPKFTGTDYAYTDTIRNRDARRCLPGCTRPECCGQLRSFAQGAGLPTAPRTHRLFPTSSSQTSNTSNGGDDDDESASDTRLLKDYLGDGYARVMRDADAEKKAQILGEAKAQDFANKHGRHRQVFQRRSTPPGFWRTEMPTTQEDMQDREEARRMEREKVEERWREALRGGGRWMFRDE